MMRQRVESTFFRRKALFLLGCVLLLMAVAHRPWVVFTLFSAKRLTNTVVLVVAGLIAVIGMHELAPLILRGKPGPWVGRRWALLFLPVALVCINALFSIADSLVCKAFGVGPFLSSNTEMYLLVAAELMWVALLE